MIDIRHRVVAGLTVLAVLAMALLYTAMAELSVQQPAPASAPEQRFSADRALVELRRFATEPRPLGSSASDRARDYLVERLRAAGLTVEVQHAVGVRSGTGLATFGRVENVVATLPGRDSTGTVLLAAHYDSAAVGPGASDDGAAVAAMLETVRALRDTGPLRNDLVLLITDGEEDGLLGAEAFVREHPLARRGGVVLNWEARGVGGPSLMFETSRNNAKLIEVFTTALPHPRGHSAMVELYRMLPNNSDFTALSRAGFVGLNSAYIEGSSHYHTAGDSVANLDPGSLQHHGENMLALTRAFGELDLATLAADRDATYFSVFGIMISYSETLVWPLAILAALLVAALAALARRQRLLGLGRLLIGVVSAVLPLSLAALFAQGLWSLLVALRPGYDTMGGLLHRPGAYQAAVVALTALSLLLWYVPARRRLGPAALAVVGLIWPAALGVLCAAYAPNAAFLFTLPALGGAVGGLVALAGRAYPVLSVAAVTLGSVPATIMLPSLARTAFTGMGLALAGAAAIVLALYGLTLLPVVEMFFPDPARPGNRRAALAVPAVAAGLAVLLVGVGLAIDRVDATHPTRSHLAYVLNADTGAATWVSGDREPTGWTRRYVHGRAIHQLPPGYARGALWTGAAPAIQAAGPELRPLSRQGDRVTFRVASRRGAGGLTLRVDHPITEATAIAPGRAPVTATVTGTRANTWPGEVRFRDLPAAGVEITLRVPGADRIRVTAIDETRTLADVPGFVPRPPEVVAATREDGELVAVACGYEL